MPILQEPVNQNGNYEHATDEEVLPGVDGRNSVAAAQADQEHDDVVPLH